MKKLFLLFLLLASTVHATVVQPPLEIGDPCSGLTLEVVAAGEVLVNGTFPVLDSNGNFVNGNILQNCLGTIIISSGNIFRQTDACGSFVDVIVPVLGGNITLTHARLSGVNVVENCIPSGYIGKYTTTDGENVRSLFKETGCVMALLGSLTVPSTGTVCAPIVTSEAPSDQTGFNMNGAGNFFIVVDNGGTGLIAADFNKDRVVIGSDLLLGRALVTAEETFNLTADNQVIEPTMSQVIITSDQSCAPCLRTFTVTAGSGPANVGMEVMLIFIGCGKCELLDDVLSGGVATNMRIEGNWTPAQFDTLTIKRTLGGTTWVQKARSANN